jgi:hypothetical protein
MIFHVPILMWSTHLSEIDPSKLLTFLSHIYHDGSVLVAHGGTEMGQGTVSEIYLNLPRGREQEVTFRQLAP